MSSNAAVKWILALGWVLCEIGCSLCFAGAPPEAIVERVSLNPTNFAVSVRITNTVPNRVFTLMAYEGPPVGLGSPAPRVKVSDCVEATTNSLLLLDTSSPLGESGRTYAVAVFADLAICNGDLDLYPIVYGPNEIFAPYPFLTNAVISSSSVATSASGQVHRIEFGEGLYTNLYVSPVDTNRVAFFRFAGTNTIPTNAVIQRSVNGIDWLPETTH